MSCARCDDEGFWCDICGEAESSCTCFDDPETDGPNFVECEDCDAAEDN